MYVNFKKRGNTEIQHLELYFIKLRNYLHTQERKKI